MATANELPGAIEAPAQIASAQDLRQAAQDTFGLPVRQPGPCLLAPTLSYKVFFFDREYGDLTDTVTTDSFDTGVQLVRDRLPVQTDYVVEATWTRGIGEMEVRSPRGTVVARVEPVADADVAVQPPVIKACAARQVGDAEPLEQLFAPLPQAA